MAGATASPLTRAAPAAATNAVADTAEPFLLGVASGDPLPDRVILWTRLVRNVFDASSLPARPIAVSWQVARDERFRQVVRAGVTVARPELAHSVHVDAKGLLPGHEYFYRFYALGQISPNTVELSPDFVDLASLRP